MARRDVFRSSSIPRAAVLAGLLSVAAPGAPQQTVHNVHLPAGTSVVTQGPESSRVRFEPRAGVLFDAYRNEGGDGRPGWIGGVRLGYELGTGLAAPGRGWRLIGEIARSETARAGTATLEDSLVVGFRSEWWLATAGVERDYVKGWTGVTLEARVGAAWLQREIVGGDSIPPGTPGTTAPGGSEPVPAVAAGIALWRHLGHRLQLRFRVEDIVTDARDALEHSPAVTLGLRFVFE